MTAAANPVARVRSTAATERRNASLRRLVTEFSLREMAVPEVADLLNFSTSGARKYIRDLRTLGVLTIARYEKGFLSSQDSPVFALTLDAWTVAEFLALLDTRGHAHTPIVVALPTRAPIRAAQAPGSFVHIMGHDSPYRVRPGHLPVKRDPWVAAIFGDGAARGAA